MERKEITINLPGIESPAIITLNRAGQTPPEEGDEIMVRWQLMLPANGEDSNYLHSSCRFGDRVEPVANVQLSQYWGTKSDRPGYVAEGGKISARKWAEAFSLAEAYVLGEVQKLIDALRARQRALREAEE